MFLNVCVLLPAGSVAHSSLTTNAQAQERGAKMYLTLLVDLRMFLPAFIGLFVCLFVCVQHNSKSYGSILMKFSGINCYIKIWKWFIFERSRSKVKVKIDQKVKFT